MNHVDTRIGQQTNLQGGFGSVSEERINGANPMAQYKLGYRKSSESNFPKRSSPATSAPKGQMWRALLSTVALIRRS